MLTAFLLSLGLTLAFEEATALAWGLRGRDLLLCALVNLLTNPAVVLLHQMIPGLGFTLVLECAVVGVEGAYYRRFGAKIPHPWGLALTANLCSFGLGLLLGGMYP